MTGPLGDQEALVANLGLLVDEQFRALDLKALLAPWQPDGAIWYAHACCSAGCDAQTAFLGVVPEGSEVASILSGVAAAGNRIAPLPTALLSAPKPARAFVGHVEPTFNWTLRRAESGQITTDALLGALYDELFQRVPPPVGFAFSRWFQQAATLRANWQAARDGVGQGREAARGRALLASLSGIDRQCTVILGDPAVAPAALPPA
jgi:hypothetical protein